MHMQTFMQLGQDSKNGFHQLVFTMQMFWYDIINRAMITYIYKLFRTNSCYTN